MAFPFLEDIVLIPMSNIRYFILSNTHPQQYGSMLSQKTFTHAHIEEEKGKETQPLQK